MIRLATGGDVQRILDLLSEVLEIHHKGRPDIFKPDTVKYTRDELYSMLDDENAPIFVYEKATRVVGYAFCIIKDVKENNILHDHKTLYIDDLCVDGLERGLGIGRALYEHVLAHAKSVGCNSITLNVWECNESARRFYEKLGLVPQKTVMEKLI